MGWPFFGFFTRSKDLFHRCAVANLEIIVLLDYFEIIGADYPIAIYKQWEGFAYRYGPLMTVRFAQLGLQIFYPTTQTSSFPSPRINVIWVSVGTQRPYLRILGSCF